VYIGLTERRLKARYNKHKQSINNAKHTNSKTLSTYVWKMKNDHKITPTLKWSIVKHALDNLTKLFSLFTGEI